MTWEQYDRHLVELARKGLAASEAGEFSLALFYVVEMIGHVRRNCPDERPLPPEIEQETSRLTERLLEFRRALLQ
jgi:hypothetical protein